MLDTLLPGAAKPVPRQYSHSGLWLAECVRERGMGRQVVEI